MDRRRTLLHLAQQLSTATDGGDWAALAALNTLLLSTLPALAQQGPWTAPEQAALAALRELHLAAVARVDAAAGALGQRMQDLTNNKEGWLAYALEGGNATTGTEA